MRLVRLNLARYGKFTDSVLDFGERQPGKPDFHVIYGPNEAGKTTTLAGFLDLVYGISKGCKYDFKHKDATEVSGVLQFNDGVTREFVRIKKTTNSLLDGAGHVVSDATILGDLENFTRDDYQMRFSLNGDRLKDGGIDILKSNGELGKLLFQASAGVNGLSDKLNLLNAECDGIFKKKAHKSAIAELKKQLEALAVEKTGLDMAWKTYSKIVALRDDLATRYDKARKDTVDAQAELSKIVQYEAAIPRQTTLNAINGKLAGLADAPDHKPELKEKVAALKADELGLEGEMKSALTAIETLKEDLSRLSVDEAALGLTEKLKSLTTFRERYNVAADLRKREEEANEIAGEIAAFLREIGRDADPDPASLLLDVSVAASLRDLMTTRSGFDTALKKASEEVAKAKGIEKAENDKLNDAKKEAGVSYPDTLALLGILVADIRKSGFEKEIRVATKAVSEHQQALADAMKPLTPWRGGPDDLGALKIPDAGVVALWGADLDAADEVVKAAANEIARIEKELKANRAKRDASSAVTGVISDGEAAQKRSDREAAWAEHRRRLDGETADAFEARLRADDDAMGLRFSHAGDVAKINATLEAIILNETLLEDAGLQLGKAEQARQKTRAAIAAAITAVSSDLTPTMTPDEFTVWSRAVDAATVARSNLLGKESDLKQVELARDGARGRLDKAMVKSGVVYSADDDLEEILPIAEKAIAEAAAIKNFSQNLTTARRRLKEREDSLAEAQADFDSWTENWSRVIGSCWIGTTHNNPSTTLVGEILLKLTDLGAKLTEHKKILGRIDSMEHDKAVFTQKIEALAAEMNEAIDGRSIEAVDDRLAARAKRADEQSLKRSGKQEDLKNAISDQEKLELRISNALAPKQEIFDLLGVTTLTEAEVALDRAREKAEFMSRKLEEEGHILKAFDKNSMEEAEAVLRNLDLASLQDKKAVSNDQLSAASTRQQELFAEKSKLDDQLDALGGDEAVALIEEKRRAIFLEIEDKARRWMRLRAGIIAAEFALRNYRDNHKSSMLTKTSEAFATITRGAYSLTTQADGASDILYGMPTDGSGARKADDLSKGTQFQLYLALRIASYHETASRRDPPSGVPFVADDIMEPFDDDRSEEAFRLLEKMAEVGQVIYLTHHQHLCAIAQKVCPTVKVHRLS